MTALVATLAALVVVLAVTLAYRSRPPRALRPPRNGRRILVPFTGGGLDPTVLDAAIRVAHAEGATLVPAYLLVVPLEYPEDSPLTREVEVAVPALEAVEHAALRSRVPVDARIEKGRTPTHALRRLWKVEHFDRVIAPAAVGNGGGFTAKDLTWILIQAPSETLLLKPAPTVAERGGDHQVRTADPRPESPSRSASGARRGQRAPQAAPLIHSS